MFTWDENKKAIKKKKKSGANDSVDSDGDDDIVGCGAGYGDNGGGDNCGGDSYLVDRTENSVHCHRSENKCFHPNPKVYPYSWP